MNNSKEDQRIRLLVVDDEQSIRKLCSTVAEALGFVCLEAESGESALALLEEQSVHMILSDMVMPRMSASFDMVNRGSISTVPLLPITTTRPFLAITPRSLPRF